MRALRVIQLQCRRHRLEDGSGRARDRPALELRVVLDADAREHRHLGAAQPGDAAVRPGRQAHMPRA